MIDAQDLEMLALADAYVAATTPAVMVPQGAGLAPLAEVGHRYLVANDGLYVEFKRAWCYGITRISASRIALPFGSVKGQFKTVCGRPPKALVSQFSARAKAAYPLEVAAWLVWDETAPAEAAWRLVDLQPISSSGSHILFHREVLRPGEHVVVDIHSHGVHPAYFSSTDNVNDAELRDVKIAVVIGQLQQPKPSTRQRLCVLGHFSREGDADETYASGL